MKSIALATAISFAATTAFAGTMEEPVIEPIIETVEETTSSSSAGGLIVPVLALILLGAAVASSD